MSSNSLIIILTALVFTAFAVLTTGCNDDNTSSTPESEEIAGEEVAGEEVAGEEIAGEEVAGEEVAGEEVGRRDRW